MPDALVSALALCFRFFALFAISTPLPASIAAAGDDDGGRPLDGGWSIVLLLAQDVSLSLSC